MFFNAFNSFTKALRFDEIHFYLSQILLIGQIKNLIKSAISGKSAREIGLLYFEIASLRSQ